MDFVRVLNIAIEIGRVTEVLSFSPPPPGYTFRGLEQVYKSSIEHYQERCEQKYREIASPKSPEDGEDRDLREQRFDELEVLLHKHCMFSSTLSSYRLTR